MHRRRANGAASRSLDRAPRRAGRRNRTVEARRRTRQPEEVRGVTREFGAAAIVRQHDDGSAEFEVPCSNHYAFRLWLFAMIDKAVVVSPPEVCDLVTGWLDELAEVK
ncbi:MAG: WYL domain-containing protein [Actinobacteria bacterium]|nr:WYL domain-containing protein [Actinomycetota bacterium]